jgi:hypothetical protein
MGKTSNRISRRRDCSQAHPDSRKEEKSRQKIPCKIGQWPHGIVLCQNPGVFDITALPGKKPHRVKKDRKGSREKL